MQTLINLKIELNPKVQSIFSIKYLELIARLVLKESDFFLFLEKKLFKKITLRLSVAFLSMPEMRKINQKYRQKNQATDVLSFAEFKSQAEIQKKIKDYFKQKIKEEIFLGEILLCPEVIRQSSKNQKIVFKEELIYIFSHGILHLLGFEHSRKMFQIQIKVLDFFKKN